MGTPSLSHQTGFPALIALGGFPPPPTFSLLYPRSRRRGNRRTNRNRTVARNRRKSSPFAQIPSSASIARLSNRIPHQLRQFVSHTRFYPGGKASLTPMALFARMKISSHGHPARTPKVHLARTTRSASAIPLNAQSAPLQLERGAFAEFSCSPACSFRRKQAACVS